MPTFPLACRSAQHPHDDRFPVVAGADAVYPVVLEAGDRMVRQASMRTLAIQGQRAGHVRETVGMRRGAGELLVTDERVILFGSRLTPDTLLVGHVLLDWIVAVGGCTGTGRFRDSDALRVIMELDDGEYVVLTATFDGDVDVHELAQDIARRTARRWLAQQGSSPLVRLWEALAEAPRLSAAVGEFALHFTPTYARVVPPCTRREHTGIPA